MGGRGHGDSKKCFCELQPFVTLKEKKKSFDCVRLVQVFFENGPYES